MVTCVTLSHITSYEFHLFELYISFIILFDGPLPLYYTSIYLYFDLITSYHNSIIPYIHILFNGLGFINYFQQLKFKVW